MSAVDINLFIWEILVAFWVPKGFYYNGMKANTETRRFPALTVSRKTGTPFPLVLTVISRLSLRFTQKVIYFPILSEHLNRFKDAHMKKYFLTLYATILASIAFGQIQFQPTEFVTVALAVGSSQNEAKESISLNNGDAITILSFGLNDNGGNLVQMQIDAVIPPNIGNRFLMNSFSGTNGVISGGTEFIAGPAEIEISILKDFSNTNPANGWVSFAIFRANSVQSPSLTPQNTIVIPENATGTLQIILESSNDLINWVAALPGNYSAETAQRFFRVRAVLQ